MFDYVEKKLDERLDKYTTLHIGGNARWFLLPKDVLQLERIIFDCRLYGIDYFILGGGSNLLVCDSGFEGAVISMKHFDSIVQTSQNQIYVGGGVNLFALNVFCAHNGFSGLEWSYGIPASVGGACKMNAGAFGYGFCQYVKSYIVFDGVRLKHYKKVKYDYRKGCLKKNEILISALLELDKSSSQAVRNKQVQFLEKRKQTQPYGEFSLGSTFKRNKDFFPAKIIDEYGFKGFKLGNIKVSEKHAGFLINEGNGTSKDFINVVKTLEEKARQNGYKFEREFVCLGFN